MGHEAKWEYFRVMYGRYSKAKGTERSRLLDEFCVTAGYHRKYAIRLLNGVALDKERVKRRNSAHGEFAHGLNVTDLHTGWTESAALVGKSEVAVQAALEEIRGGLPFRLLGVDSDNGSEFINWHLKRWCDREQIQLSRGRPYKKDDNAHIEQKNWTHVRKLLGWERYESQAAVEAINAVYRQELRLWMNLYQPSVKLVKKVRVGSKLRRVYSPAQTPFERVLASGQWDSRRVAELKKLRSLLDPFELSHSIDRKLESIYALANRRLSPKAITSRGAMAVQKTRGGKVQKQNFSTWVENPNHAGLHVAAFRGSIR